MTKLKHAWILGLIFTAASAAPAAAQLAPQERLCDPTFQDCRADLITYIRQETQEIDVGEWMITDARYSNELIAAWNRGVRVRILMDPRCTQEHAHCEAQQQALQDAGIPMRYRKTSGILHWKTMIFASQGQIEFSGANFAPFEFVPQEPYVNFTDEIIFYTNTPSLVQSFMRKFDDLWTSTTEFGDFANITGPLTRSYPMYDIDPDLNFPPDQPYRNRAVSDYNKEMQNIDVMMFRITDQQHSFAMINAINRGVPVRLITDETEYRNPDRLWDAYNVDMMYHAGVQVRLDAHQGIDHAKGVLLYGTGLAIFGSSNWTSPSNNSQREHNYFTTKPSLFNWIRDTFNRKWTNGAGYSETKPFTPLPPGVPTYNLPANGATDVPTDGVKLSWYAGLWGQIYDVYFGTSPNPPLLAANLQLGPSQTTNDFRTYALPTLQPGTTYYWKIVSKTMAYVTSPGTVWSFTTAGGSGGGGSTLPTGWSNGDVGNTGAAGSASYASPTFTVRGAGADVWGTSDAFQFAYTTLSGDGTIVARVATIQNVAAWTKAGVMIRGSLSPSSAFAFVMATPGKGVAFQRRPADGSSAANTAGSTSTAPRWVRIDRSGNTITAFESANGTTWSTIGSATVTLPSTAYIGLAVSSHVTGTLAQATFDSVNVSTSGGTTNAPPTVSLTSPANGAAATEPATFTLKATAADSDGTIASVKFFAGTTLLATSTASPYTFTWSNVTAGSYTLTAVATDDRGASTTSSPVSVTVNPANQDTLPPGWSQQDIGSVPFAGAGTYTTGTFRVTGSGADIWDTADAFHYVYTTMSGDGTVIARVVTVQNADKWTKAGVMIRESLTPGSEHAFMLVSPSKGLAFQRRDTTGGESVNTAGSLNTAPRWVKLTRSGTTFSAYESADGANWTLVGTDTISMGTAVYAGLAVTSHTVTKSATATFDNVVVQ
jgi:phosphatidylserine/phosphatidylglycerophosphate/cardiolipin synthase-like enzyme